LASQRGDLAGQRWNLASEAGDLRSSLISLSRRGRDDSPCHPKLLVDLGQAPDLRPEPMLDRPASFARAAGYAYEMKWDGFRSLVSTDGLAVRSRRGWKMTPLLPDLLVPRGPRPGRRASGAR